MTVPQRGIQSRARSKARVPSANNSPGKFGRPTSLDECIILPSGKLGLRESAERVFRLLAKSETIFLRGGKVCELVRDELDKLDPRRVDDELLRLEVVDEQAFRSRIERYGKVVAFRAGPHRGQNLVMTDARCSLDTAKVWLASEARKNLPPITAIHNCPLLIECDGSVKILTKGYYRELGGRLITGGQCPLGMDLGEAVTLLLEVIDEFDFLTAADKSRALAAIITPAMKFAGLLAAHTPLFVVEADESQAGKGFFLEIVQAIYQETPSFVTQRQKGVGGLDESLSQALLNGRPFIQLDNVRGGINSQYFEAILTCPLHNTIPARVPYKGEIQINPERFVFQLTSNGFESTRDLANRSSIVRLRKRRGFVFRSYPEGTLIDHVRSNQPRFLGAVFRIVRQWIGHGKQTTSDTRGEGRFRRWAQIQDWILKELFTLAPLMDGHMEAQERASNPALNWLRRVCIVAESDARIEESLSASEIVEICQRNSIDIPGLANDASESRAALRIGCIMGRIFRDSDQIQCSSFQIRRTETLAFMESSGQEKKAYRYVIGLFLPTNPNQQSQQG